MNIELYIYNGKKVYIPSVINEITWTTERTGTPGKLEFKVYQDDKLKFTEGNAVSLVVDGKKIFYGYVFKKQRSDNDTISVTAYDQLRYFKNKDTIVYAGKKANELLELIAKSYNLHCGSLVDTGYIIPQRIENNKTLFDMMQNALDLTMMNTGKIYTLYDNFGELTLANIENMKRNILIDTETCQGIEYTSSIDGDTYNKVKLTYDNEETGKRDVYIVKDSSNVNNWGVLQYYDTLQEGENGAVKAEQLLKYYNQKERSLSIKGALGNKTVRAGCYIFVALKFDDLRVENYMLCEKVVHKFEENNHTMDLTLIGGKFNSG